MPPTGHSALAGTSTLKTQTTHVEALQAPAKVEPAQTTAPAPEPVVAPPTQPTAPTGDKLWIYQKESGNNPGAVNTIGACGLGQALPCSKMSCSLSDYTCQDNFFTGYMQSRYGSWAAAKAFWISHATFYNGDWHNGWW